ncbi:MAG: sigma-54 dependent transcriptional regulator [Planctomycetes bacterium]|nr:sigma-54 dependent transcriptional regulator [Planctomycetota bacterium]
MQESELTRSQIYRTSSITFDDLESSVPKVQEVIRLAKRVATTDLTVLLLGESGTGKNFLAQAIHTSSRRLLEPFVVVNCAALTDTLLESELFGHEKGAFTGAEREKRGKFELAGAGTLFLDEVSDLSAAAQAKILRAVEYRQFERVGGEATFSTKARFIAASNRDLKILVKEGKFRRDLYYRLAEFTISLVPLHERSVDILRLANKIAHESAKKMKLRFSKFTPESETWLLRNPWTGNIRELKNVIRVALVLAEDGIISADLLEQHETSENKIQASGEALSMQTVEMLHIEKILKLTGGNKSESARILGITRPTLDKKIKQYKINLD